MQKREFWCNRDFWCKAGPEPLKVVDSGPVVSLRLTLPQTLDPVEEQHPLLIVKQLVVEAINRFAENRPQYLVWHCVLQYTLYCHQDLDSCWSGLGVLACTAGAASFPNVFILAPSMSRLYTVYRLLFIQEL